MNFEIREEYLTGNILEVGTIVEDINNGQTFTILHRGPNYITVASENGDIMSKWLHEVKVNEEVKINTPSIVNGQLSYTGFISSNLDEETALMMEDIYEDAEDKFAYRFALVNLDSMINESDLSKKYDTVIKVEEYFKKMGVEYPFLLDEAKSSIEQMRIAQLIASVPDSDLDGTPAEIINKSIEKMRSDKVTKQQWDVLKPLFVTAKKSGIAFSSGKLPFQIKESEEDLIMSYLEQNLDELVEDLDYDDLLEEFDEEELTEDILQEVLTIQARNRLARGTKVRSTRMAKRREVASKRAASVSTLMGRARRLANQMLKKRLFKKSAKDMSRAEKERYESGASRRKALVARLAKRLMGKVRQIQNQRLHSSKEDSK